MKMSYLEEYIREQKSLFDEEPATGHFERLQEKMDNSSTLTGLSTLSGRRERNNLSGCEAADRVEKRNAVRVEKQNKTIRTIHPALRWTISIAASIAVLFAAGILWQYSGKQKNMLVCENAADMKICYLDKMNLVAGQIETLIKDFDKWDQQDVMNEVQNIIEAAGDFDREIPEELPEDRTKAILSEFYRQNLESLEMIAQIITN